VALTYLAFGLDPERATLFRQSDVPQHTELFWILGSVVPLSDLSNAHSYKDKLAQGLKPEFGLFSYPVLMAADILVYGADQVPVGKDQKQHVEYARDWATKFNLAFVSGYDPAHPGGEAKGPAGVLKLPEARMKKESAVVVGTDGRKMSKSYNNAIELFASDRQVKKAIMGITTDSTPIEAPKPLENSALYQLLELLAAPEEFQELDRSWREGGLGYGHYKQALLDLFHARFDGARAEHARLAADPGQVEEILKRGAERARGIAEEQMQRVRQAAGL
jgi:tryptophanyl-tRNA synthetase